MEKIACNVPPRFQALGCSQDKIGWQWFLEGMISKEITKLQNQYIMVNGFQMSHNKWSSGLTTRLLEITHAQWIYFNYVVHNPIASTIAKIYEFYVLKGHSLVISRNLNLYLESLIRQSTKKYAILLALD